MSEEGDMTIEEFCDMHRACDEGLAWALMNCKTMRDVWNTAKNEWLVWVATRRGVLSDRECRLFAVHCAKSVEHLIADQQLRDAISVAERLANGEATQGELAAARSSALDAALASGLDAALAAARSSALDAAMNAALAAAMASPRAAAWSSARSSARSSALDAARSSAWSSSRSSALDAAEYEQSVWLRANTQPCFKS